MKNTVTVELTLEDKAFTNDKNELVNYCEASLVLGGERFLVKFRKEDRALLRVIRRTLEEK